MLPRKSVRSLRGRASRAPLFRGGRVPIWARTRTLAHVILLRRSSPRRGPSTRLASVEYEAARDLSRRGRACGRWHLSRLESRRASSRHDRRVQPCVWALTDVVIARAVAHALVWRSCVLPRSERVRAAACGWVDGLWPSTSPGVRSGPKDTAMDRPSTANHAKEPWLIRAQPAAAEFALRPPSVRAHRERPSSNSAAIVKAEADLWQLFEGYRCSQMACRRQQGGCTAVRCAVSLMCASRCLSGRQAVSNGRRIRVRRIASCSSRRPDGASRRRNDERDSRYVTVVASRSATRHLLLNCAIYDDSRQMSPMPRGRRCAAQDSRRAIHSICPREVSQATPTRPALPRRIRVPGCARRAAVIDLRQDVGR